MKKILLLISILAVISTIHVINLYAEEEKPAPKGMGLTVEPGGMLVQHVPIGITYDFTKEVGIPLTIHNRDDKPHTYILTTNRPSEVAARKWLKGYLEIPNPGWMWLEKDEVKIEPNGTSKVNMYLKIPKADKYYNQHWAASLGVRGKPEGEQMFALAVYPRVEIETLSKEDINEIPHGIIATQPSALLFEGAPLGKEQRLKLKIFNSDEKEHRYKITPMIFPYDPKKRQIFTSPKYSWIPDTNWIKPDRSRINIKPHSAEGLTVKVRIPKRKEYYNRDWEAILFIEPKEGLPGFARIQIKTEPMKKE